MVSSSVVHLLKHRVTKLKNNKVLFSTKIKKETNIEQIKERRNRKP